MEFKNKNWARPSDLKPGDALAIKIVARIGYAEDWAAYEGPTDWTDEQVAEGGDKLLAEQAKPLFPICRHLEYRGG